MLQQKSWLPHFHTLTLSRLILPQPGAAAAAGTCARPQICLSVPLQTVCLLQWFAVVHQKPFNAVLLLQAQGCVQGHALPCWLRVGALPLSP
jgi:hypothetical protein